MVPLLIAISIVVPILLAAFNSNPDHAKPSPTAFLPSLVLGLLSAGILPNYAAPDPAHHLAIGIAAGTVIALVAGWISHRDEWVAPAGLGVGLSTLILLAPTADRAVLSGGALIGVGIVAASLLSRGSTVAAIAALAAIAANQLGSFGSPDSPRAMAGSAIGVALLLVGAALTFGSKSLPNSKAWGPVAALLIGGSLAFALGQQWLGSMDFAIVAGLGVLAAWVLSLLETDKPSSLRSLLAGALLLGVATIGFSLGRGFGMALALTSCVVVGAAMQSRLVLSATGPLAALVLYRVFRETHPDLTKALDLGQHFSLIGFLAGALVTLVADEWLTTLEEGAESLKSTGLALIIATTLGLVPVIGMLLGSRGFVGWVVGLGMGAVFQSLQVGRSSRPLAIAGGIGAASIAIYPSVSPLIEVARDQKVQLLGVTLVGLAVAAAIVLGLGRKVGTKQNA
ncbi:MAG: hypothetical protein ACOYON_10890 [Fimbriimonas sp.]